MAISPQEGDALAGDAPGEARITDRQRLGVVLQGAALLSHLHAAGCRLAGGWDRTRVTGDGGLRVTAVAAGRDRRLPQEVLARLLRSLFRTEAGVAGRGEGRRAARELLERWDQGLVASPPDRLVEDVLQAAPFLWEPAFVETRCALVAQLRESPGGDGEGRLHLAGPSWWSSRLRALAEDRDELEEILEEGEVPRELMESRHDSSSPDEAEGGQAGAPSASEAAELFRRGRFEAALDALAERPFRRGAVLRVRCHLYLGQLGAARRVLGRLERLEDLAPREVVEAAEVATRVLAALGRPQDASAWVERALAAAAGAVELRPRAEVLAAVAAWDRGDGEAMDRHLEAAREDLERPDLDRQDPEQPQLAWRWHHAAGLRALAADPRAAAGHLRRSLAVCRRSLARFEAAGLWNDLGVARAGAGDLPAAERAFLHASRLYEHCDGPRRLTLAFQNLAEVRLRRGRPSGVRRILERATEADRRAGNRRALAYDAALWVRLELVLGRPEAALDRCRETLEELEGPGVEPQRAALEVLAARALGWLGETDAARRALERSVGGWDGDPLAELEPEERPALWALAGERERALVEARELAEHGGDPAPPGPASIATLWQALLTGEAPALEAWGALKELEPFRAGRWVLDAEAVAPGSVPAAPLRRAVATFRRLGAGLWAERLEARDQGPWRVLAAYLAKSPGRQAWSDLFVHAGCPEVRIWWERGTERAEVLVDGPGGGEELSTPHHGGRLVLTAPEVEGPVPALFRLVARDFLPEEGGEPAPSRGGMVGESPALVEALERLERFAASELPVLVKGESGTGKELAARHLHRASSRAEGPFVAVNCAALSETLILSDLFGHVRGAFTGADRDRAGVFETAQGGTVFLDEIGDLPAPAQGLLLRVLQEGEVRRVGESLPRRVDVRVVAASHRSLDEMVAAGEFRQDLFFRLRGAAVELPPLRDRGGDVLALAEHFLRRLGGGDPPKLSAAARRRLQAHDWPGNVRELENVLGTALALAAGGGRGGAVTLEEEHLDLPEREHRPAGDYHQQVETFRRRLVEEALEASGGNQSEAARRLGLTRQALSYLVRQLEIR